MEEHQCCKQIRTDRAFYSHQCPRKGTIVVNGKWYCWQHDPERVARLCKENQEKFDRKHQASRDERYRRLAEQDVCKGVSTEELEELGTNALRELLDILKGD